MSKSKGNVIDPLDVIDKFGADALRYTLSLMAAQGRDIKLSEENVKINRNFITKIRNAYNFLSKNQCFDTNTEINYELKNNANIWIFKEFNDHLISISSNIENYKFNEATKDIYKFTKNIFCDWYLEIIKINLNNETDVSIKEEIKVCASKVFQNILKLAHPFIPFMTDDIYVNYLKNKKFLIQDDWPTIISFKFLKDSNNEIENIIKLTTICRNIKANLKIEPKIILEAFYTSDDLAIENNKYLIDKLGRVNINKVKSSELDNKNFMKFVDNSITLYINKLQIDNENLLSKNTSTLEEQLLNLENDIAILRKKVENDDFLKKAPKIVIDKFVKKMKHKLSLKDKILTQIKS